MPSYDNLFCEPPATEGADYAEFDFEPAPAPRRAPSGRTGMRRHTRR